MVSQRGIEANLEKVKAIFKMSSSKTVKEVQKLTRRVTTLNRFVSKATNKCLPFFKTLNQAFVWMDECEAAFQELKLYLSNPPLLSLSKEGEDLFLYLSVNIHYGCERDINSRREQDTTPNILYQPGFSRSWGQISTNGKDHVRPDRGLWKAPSIFLGEPHSGNDRSTN